MKSGCWNDTDDAGDEAMDLLGLSAWNTADQNKSMSSDENIDSAPRAVRREKRAYVTLG